MIRDNGVPISDPPAGSPSKILAASLGSVSLNGSNHSHGATEHIVIPQRIEKKRVKPKKAENHITDELQLIVDPSPAASLAQKQLRNPDPNVGKLEARKEAEAAMIRAMHGPDHPGAVSAPPRNAHYDDPLETQKLWVQESLLRMALPGMVQAWEARQTAKLESKANKGKKAAGRRSPSGKAPVEHESKSSTPTKASGKPYRKPTKVTVKPVIETDSEPEASLAPSRRKSEDVFAMPALSNDGTQPKIDKQRHINTKANTSVAKYKRSKACNMASTSSSSDSDIQLVSTSQVPPRKSPRKSPRRTQSQQTARSAAASVFDRGTLSAAEPAVLIFNAVQKGPRHAENNAHDTKQGLQRPEKSTAQPKKAYSYRDLAESDSDSGVDELPPLTRLLKTKDGTASRSDADITRAGSLSQPQSLSSGVLRESSKRATATRTGSAARHPRGQVIDLCSSD